MSKKEILEGINITLVDPTWHVFTTVDKNWIFIIKQN